MDDRVCLLVIIGVNVNRVKEPVAVNDRYRESAARWSEVLIDLRQRGLLATPKLTVGDGTLGFWSALGSIYPETR